MGKRRRHADEIGGRDLGLETAPLQLKAPGFEKIGKASVFGLCHNLKRTVYKGFEHGEQFRAQSGIILRKLRLKVEILSIERVFIGFDCTDVFSKGKNKIFIFAFFFTVTAITAKLRFDLKLRCARKADAFG